MTREHLASFAPTALRYESLRSLAYRGADRLVVLIRAAIAAGAPPRVALVGGVFADTGMRDRVLAGVLRELPDADIVEARYDPARGALLLAYRELGLQVTKLQE